MPQAFITRLNVKDGVLTATVSVQQSDPLSFVNVQVSMPYDAAFQALPRQQQKAAIIAAYRAMQPPPNNGSNEIDPTPFSSGVTV